VIRNSSFHRGRYAQSLMHSAGGAYIAFHVCAPRTRATSLSPHPIRGLFCFVTVADTKGPPRRIAATRENALRIQVWPALIAILLPKWHTPIDGHRSWPQP